MDDPISANRTLWDSWVPHHVASDFYDVEAFVAGATSLDRLERDAAGDVGGRSLLHLQCHFGKDTISFARLGARVTGVDFSAAAIAEADRLAQRCAVPARFVEAEVTTLDLGERFDVVFTSNGVLGWLADLPAWGRVIARHLRPGGRFALVEGHPVMWLFDDDTTERALHVRYPYFDPGAPLRLSYRGTYAAPDADVESVEHAYVHSLGDVLGALLDAGLRIDSFVEHDVVAWRALPFMERDDEGFWGVPADVGHIPLSYTVIAHRPA